LKKNIFGNLSEEQNLTLNYIVIFIKQTEYLVY